MTSCRARRMSERCLENEDIDSSSYRVRRMAVTQLVRVDVEASGSPPLPADLPNGLACEMPIPPGTREDELVPDGADYAGHGCWRYRGFTIQAIEQENPLDGRRFKFVAVARAKSFLFDDLIQAAACLDGVHHGMQQVSDKPVMVRRPYEIGATPLDDATDLTVAT